MGSGSQLVLLGNTIMNNLTTKLLALGASGVIAITGGYMVGPWEGVEKKAYQDIVGVWTICYGETKGVTPGMVKTQEQCEQSLASELQHYNTQMKKNVKVPLPEHMEIAYTSFVWNVGVGAWNSSTLLKLLNQKKYDEACTQLLRWNKAGGKVVKGLVNRREAEYKTCTGNNEATNNALEELRNKAGKPLDVSAERASENDAIQSEDKGLVGETPSGEPVNGLVNDWGNTSGGDRPPYKVASPTCRFSLGSWCLWKVA